MQSIGELFAGNDSVGCSSTTIRKLYEFFDHATG